MLVNSRHDSSEPDLYSNCPFFPGCIYLLSRLVNGFKQLVVLLTYLVRLPVPTTSDHRKVKKERVHGVFYKMITRLVGFSK